MHRRARPEVFAGRVQNFKTQPAAAPYTDIHNDRRSDFQESLKLGEAVAIATLEDFRSAVNEDYHGCTFTKFDGTKITVRPSPESPHRVALR